MKNQQITDQEIYHLMDQNSTKEKGFRLLMTTFQRDLYWHIQSLVVHHSDVDDVLQNTFIKVFRHFDGFKRESALYTWIYRIATNEALNHLKKIKIRQEEDLKEFDYSSYQDTMSGEDITERLNGAMATLPEKQRLVFNMRYFNEMSYNEMSEVLQTSVGALKASYHFAVKKIEAELKK